MDPTSCLVASSWKLSLLAEYNSYLQQKMKYKSTY